MTKNETVKTSPTKQFFVSMLTRDINLDDAILDLIDNCIDGALRSSGGRDPEYSKFEISIHVTEDKFTISDNCGGIPKDVAINYAFKMGRSADDNRDKDAETIGMYGVGMKRALFKMGEYSTVYSNTREGAFRVEIKPDWMQSESWDEIPLQNIEPRGNAYGTEIEVNKLTQGVSKLFKAEVFVNDLRKSVSEHFMVFLQKGLIIRINDEAVKPIILELLVHDDPKLPAPFVYERVRDGVTVSIAVGHNTSSAIDSDDAFEQNRDVRSSGWTVLCNDRAILVGDKTRLTGWGDNVPVWHGQFSVLTGIIEFRSSDASKLPVTTTKRAVDTSSDIWLEAFKKMREAMAVWTGYTNKWKNVKIVDRKSHWNGAVSKSLHDVIRTVIATRDMTSKQDGGIEYNPRIKDALPVPQSTTQSTRRISFSKPKSEIDRVAEYLFENTEVNPGAVGEECFRIILDEAKV